MPEHSPEVLAHLAAQGITIVSSKTHANGVTIHQGSVERGRGMIISLGQGKTLAKNQDKPALTSGVSPPPIPSE